MNDRDPATYNEASETPDMGELDSPAEVLAERMQEQIPWKKLTSKQEFCMAAASVAIQSVGKREAPEKAKEVITRLLAEIIDAPTPADAQLTAECYDFAFGLGINGGKSQTEIAVKYSVTRATVSRRCRQIVTHFSGLGVRPSAGMKSERACAVYAEVRKGQKRKPAPKWKFAGIVSKEVLV